MTNLEKSVRSALTPYRSRPGELLGREVYVVVAGGVCTGISFEDGVDRVEVSDILTRCSAAKGSYAALAQAICCAIEAHIASKKRVIDGDMIMLAEYARRNGRSPTSARQRALRGGFKTAVKVDGVWWVREDEPYGDHRRKIEKMD